MARLEQLRVHVLARGRRELVFELGRGGELRSSRWCSERHRSGCLAALGRVAVGPCSFALAIGRAAVSPCSFALASERRLLRRRLLVVGEGRALAHLLRSLGLLGNLVLLALATVGLLLI